MRGGVQATCRERRLRDKAMRLRECPGVQVFCFFADDQRTMPAGRLTLVSPAKAGVSERKGRKARQRTLEEVAPVLGIDVDLRLTLIIAWSDRSERAPEFSAFLKRERTREEPAHLAHR